MSSATDELARPVFTHSTARAAIGWILLAPIVTGFCFYSALFEPVGLISSLILFLVGTIPELELLYLWAESIWAFSFYDQYAEVRGRKFHKKFVYTDVTDVTTKKSGFGPVRLTITLKGESKPLTLTSNPVNETKVDLGSWLQARTVTSTTHETVPQATEKRTTHSR